MTSPKSTKNNRYKRVLFLYFSLLIIALSFGYFFWQIPYQKLQRPFNAIQAEKNFERSQWRVPNSRFPISDSQLYSYAGYRYVRGENPILINPEAPPLGKYLIGAGILLFGNEHYVPLLFTLAGIMLTGWLAYSIGRRSLFAASIAVLLTTTSWFTLDQVLNSPQLEIFQLVFGLLAILFAAQHLKQKNYRALVYAGIAAGLFAAVKIFIFSYVVMAAWIGLIFWISKKTIRERIISFVVFNGALFSTFTLTYIQYFLQGGSLRGFLGVQKWIFLFYRESGINSFKLFGSYLPLIFANQWRFWTEGYPYIQYDHWSSWWRVLFVLSVISLVYLLRVKLALSARYIFISLFSFWTVYSVALLFIPIFPRYLLLLFVPGAILSAVFFDRLLKLYEHHS